MRYKPMINYVSEDGPLRVETCSFDFKSINKTFVALKAEYVKG
jgi:hypothetical protein